MTLAVAGSALVALAALAAAVWFSTMFGPGLLRDPQVWRDGRLVPVTSVSGSCTTKLSWLPFAWCDLDVSYHAADGRVVARPLSALTFVDFDRDTPPRLKVDPGDGAVALSWFAEELPLRWLALLVASGGLMFLGCVIGGGVWALLREFRLYRALAQGPNPVAAEVLGVRLVSSPGWAREVRFSYRTADGVERKAKQRLKVLKGKHGVAPADWAYEEPIPLSPRGDVLLALASDHDARLVKASFEPLVLTDTTPSPERADVPAGSPGEVFSAFLKLGLTSFGGPVAHLGYFRDELIVHRRWLDEAGYADLIALCQFLPGPASSQVGFALGLMRAGPLGALAAWCAFTLPSALLLVLFAALGGALAGPAGHGLLHGLKLVAVAIVAQAVWGMARTLAPDRSRAGIALAALLIVVFIPSAAGQVAALAAGGLAGLRLCRDVVALPAGMLSVLVSRPVGLVALATFGLLLLGLPLLAAATGSHVVALAAAFYRAGALVFGGGHVVLPLLQAAVVPPGWLSADSFLAGYGAAQAIPGPLFTVAAYLGAAMTPAPHGLLGAAVCLAAIFLPGLLLVTGALPFWGLLRARPAAQAAMRGTNAAVVGILAAALYDPVWVSAVLTPRDFAAALAGFLLLTVWRAPPWAVILVLVPTGIALHLAG